MGSGEYGVAGKRPLPGSFGFRGGPGCQFRDREGRIEARRASGVRAMSSQINFQRDATECLRMAEHAKGQEGNALVVGLARAWGLFGGQLKHLDHWDEPAVLQ